MAAYPVCSLKTVEVCVFSAALAGTKFLQPDGVEPSTKNSIVARRRRHSLVELFKWDNFDVLHCHVKVSSLAKKLPVSSLQNLT